MIWTFLGCGVPDTIETMDLRDSYDSAADAYAEHLATELDHKDEQMMTQDKQEFLLLSRGQWDSDKSPEEIQAAIDNFYAWHERLVAEGKLKPGQRLATAGKVVSRRGITEGPFAEAKEVIGGYWFILAGSLEEAAGIAMQNPCLACGLSYEIRPIEEARASAYNVTNETPSAKVEQ